MDRTGKALIVSDDRDFITKYERYLTGHNYKSEFVPTNNNWNEFLLNDKLDLFLIDNIKGTFPFEYLIKYMNSNHLKLFLLIVGNEPVKRYNTSSFIFLINPESDEISLKSLFTNVGKIIKYEKLQSDLTGMILHDIRSPLNSLIGYLELLLNSTFGSLKTGHKNILEKAMELGDETLDLLEDLNEIFSRNQNKIILSKNKFNLSDIIDQVLVNIWIKADRKNIKIKKEIQDELGAIYGDDFQIQRVLTNLLGNAVKYSPENSEIKIRAVQNHQNEIEISIVDYGQGVPEESLPNLFDKNFRVKDERKVVKGYGLGLYICRTIVRAHRGKIWAKNNPHGGMTFSFILPGKPK